MAASSKAVEDGLLKAAAFRRQRATRACETCNRRKVRCDAATLGVPCTNCVAFNCACRVPEQRRKRKDAKIHGRDRSTSVKSGSGNLSPDSNPLSAQPVKTEPSNADRLSVSRDRTLPVPKQPPSSLSTRGILNSALPTERMKNDVYVGFLNSDPTKDRIPDPGESSNLTLLVHDADRNDEKAVYHFPGRAHRLDFDQEELEILKKRGALLLPPREVCDDLVECFFEHVAPLVPVVDRTRFMKQYNDPSNPPSILLLQAMFLAGSRVCKNPAILDASGTARLAGATFYKRAKALYDANYEENRIAIVQALVLLNWHWEDEGADDNVQNSFYWCGVAIRVAQGIGLHRSTARSQMSAVDKKLWKRIWWTLFTRDRLVAAALGRPTIINTNDSDVPMLSEDDFLEGESGDALVIPPRADHVHFFLNLVRLCEIMGIVLSRHYAPKSNQQNPQINLTHSDMALASWMMTLPPQMRYNPQDQSRHRFWPALLHSYYYTTLCMLHRVYMGQTKQDCNPYPSRNIAFTASAMITRITENLDQYGELQYMPAFTVHTLFSAVVMHIYQLKSASGLGIETAQNNVDICMSGLKELSKPWAVGKMVYRLLAAVVSSPLLAARMQKALQSKAVSDKSAGKASGEKRKLGALSESFAASRRTTANVSFERSSSRPASPKREEQNDMDGFLMNERTTRPPSPFAPILSGRISGPTSPPQDLYLVTRSEPPIDQSLLESFQPNHLFPEDFGVYREIQQQQIQQGGFNQPVGLAPGMIRSPYDMPMMSVPTPLQWHPQLGEWEEKPDGSPGNMSSCSSGTAPTSFNIEDWYQYFGLEKPI